MQSNSRGLWPHFGCATGMGWLKAQALIAPLAAALLLAAPALPAQEPQVPNRPRVPGQFRMNMRRQVHVPDADGAKRGPAEQEIKWYAAETAIIICDMWDGHYCRLCAQRVNAMAPRMNEMISAARERGVMIIHAPSGVMDVYKDTPYRRRMQQATAFEPPVPIGHWCFLDADREPPLPIDDSLPCDDPVVEPAVQQFSKQHPALEIIGYDGVSDSGTEIYNFLRQEKIKNVAIMGVHTNMCVLGRPFGIRQMTKLGLNVVLVRDMTDCMYDPRQPPYVSHARGLELVVEHIEEHWCPSVLSTDLMSVIPGTDDPGQPLEALNSGG